MAGKYRGNTGGGRGGNKRPAAPAATAPPVPVEADELSTSMIVAGAQGDRAVAIASHAETRTQEVQGAILIARKFPRSEDESRVSILRTCANATFAEKCRYKYPRGDTMVTGISVVGARELARAWRNIRSGFSIVADDLHSRTVEAFAWDLESNEYTSQQATFRKLVQRKTGWVVPDERDLLELTNRNAAKVVRNCILHIMPWLLVDEIKTAIENTLLSDAKANPDRIKNSVIDSFAKLNVPIRELEEFLGHSMATASPAELEKLRGIWRAINEGETSWAKVFRPETAPTVTPDPATVNAFAGATARTIERPSTGTAPTGDKRGFLPPELRPPDGYAGTEVDHLLDVIAKGSQKEVDAVLKYVGAADHFPTKERLALMQAATGRAADFTGGETTESGEVPFAPAEPSEPAEPTLPPEVSQCIAEMRKHAKSEMTLQHVFSTKWVKVVLKKPELEEHTPYVQSVLDELRGDRGDK